MKAVSIALLAGIVGCLSVQPVLAAEGVEAKQKVLHSFGSGPDGAYLVGGLIDVNGTLYGTTIEGGASGGGTVFAADPDTGAETVLHSFGSGMDGTGPYAGLVDVKGTLYGTTYYGGTYDDGTVFALDPKTGAETVVYSFCYKHYPYCTDGDSPEANLIDENGTLYGTTFAGGASGEGTVFALDPNTGKEKVLHSFGNGDGEYPYASLIDLKGRLYGTTFYGGRGYGGTSDAGTVFSVDPNTGKEKVLYSFCSQQNCTDGGYPSAGLIDVKGTLYSTTNEGGTYDLGTVFALDPSSGAETVLHSFGGGTDGAYPQAGLIDVKGTLFGTTPAGGGVNDNCLTYYSCGTAFSVDPTTGAETVAYSFCSQQNCTDGATPFASLLDVRGTLYGTTDVGGSYGGGTVFSLKRP
ncbi:MAG TPA: choice-of-anchor tandem repeat GloVer-containing protein [Stellaceae bacterium]|jgi:uncharacterized repeat protein (TIGR03803 family)|nr:choice-of-anchor tandem repeat GloVer-containing protein [Stellaceae bacterium]